MQAFRVMFPGRGLSAQRALPDDGFADAPQMPAPGDLLASKYVVEHVIGEGGVGVVYAARHRLLDVPVALKVLQPDARSEECVARFLHEAQVTARIDSAHVCRVLDVGLLDDGSPYIAMERLEGADLADVLSARGPMRVAEAVDLALQALEGLAHCHEAGAVHRDLKPTNLFLHRGPRGQVVLKLLDFGISKSHLMSGVTSVGAFLGSPTYMAPEQIADSSHVDARTDVWAMGVVLYEMLAGALPFDAQTMPELIWRVLEQSPAPLSARRNDVPAELEALVLRCLRRNPAERFGSARELALALAPFARTGPSTPPPSRSPYAAPAGVRWEEDTELAHTVPASVPPPPARRSRLTVMTVAIAMLLLLVNLVAAARWLSKRGHGAPGAAAASASVGSGGASEAPRAE